MRFILLYSLLFYSWLFVGQSLSPQVINSAGGGGAIGTSSIEVYYNIGEPFIATLSEGFSDLTQGFLQPNMIGEFGLDFTPLVSNETCLDEKDGKITLSLNAQPSSTNLIKYKWTPLSICPSQNCASVDSLAPGSYSVNVIAYNINNLAIDSVSYSYNIIKSIEPCIIKVYNGFTPNGDGINDYFQIDNIENYPQNKVTIYSRWGNIIASFTNYDNTSTTWKGESLNGNIVPSGTYFYVIEIGDGLGFKKGWVEVTN